MPEQIEKTVIIVFIAKELKEGNNDVTLQRLDSEMTLLCNGFTLPGHGVIFNYGLAFKKAVYKYFINKAVYFRFHIFCLSMFTNKATLFLTMGYTGKQPIIKDF